MNVKENMKMQIGRTEVSYPLLSTKTAAKNNALWRRAA